MVRGPTVRSSSWHSSCGALAPAGDVVADVQHPPRARHGGEQRVEGGHAVGVRRRHRQPLADVVQRALADPADARLHRLQRGQQQMAPGARLVAAGGGMRVAPSSRTPPSQPDVGAPRNASTAVALLGRGSRPADGDPITLADSRAARAPPARRDSAGSDRLDPHRAGLELGSAGLRDRSRRW